MLQTVFDSTLHVCMYTLHYVELLQLGILQTKQKGSKCGEELMCGIKNQEK